MLAAQVFYVISIIYIFIGDTLGILRMLSLEKIVTDSLKMRPLQTIEKNDSRHSIIITASLLQKNKTG